MRLRFRLATVFVTMTVIAVLVWGYWIALPDWQDYQRRRVFEELVSKLKVGPERNLFKALNYKENLITTKRFDVGDNPVEITPFRTSRMIPAQPYRSNHDLTQSADSHEPVW